MQDFDGAAEFFADLAVEGGFGGFAGLDLAAGEFPFEAEVFVRRALRHEHEAVAFDQGADDGDDGGRRHKIGIYVENGKAGNGKGGLNGEAWENLR